MTKKKLFHGAFVGEQQRRCLAFVKTLARADTAAANVFNANDETETLARADAAAAIVFTTDQNPRAGRYGRSSGFRH